MNFKQELITWLAQETKLTPDEVALVLAVPPDPKLGDYAFPCFKFGKNPHQAAVELKAKLHLPKFLAKAEVVGPYLNFFLNKMFLIADTLSTIQAQKQKYGTAKAGKNIVVEYCSPNTNKPLHLGHLRNMALGDCMCRLLSFRGNTVHPVSVINDRGVHICQSLLAYQKWGKNQQPTKKGDHFVGDFYVLFAQRLKEDANLKREAQAMLQQWEGKDTATIALWRKMTAWVLKGFTETYTRFGISFEKEYFESSHYEKGKQIVLEGLQKKIFKQDDTKAIFAPLQSYGLPDKVVLRGDGTSLYITQDLYLAQQRYQDFKFDQMMYVVASEQNVHFKQLFKILEHLERPYAQHLYHLSYGLVNLPTGRMKSREGTVVDADTLMNEMHALARQEVEQRYPDLAEKERERRAEFIGLAALKFYLLRVDAVRDMIFNPEESIGFEGETGPYLQYTHARACSILRKAGKLAGKAKLELLVDPQEYALVSLLAQFPDKVYEAAHQYKPHLLCRYLLDLAQAFNEFYHALSVISNHRELMQARLALVDAVRQALATGLDLLGIHAPEEM